MILEIVGFFCYLGTLGLTISLLIIENYFSVDEQPDLFYGLKGVNLADQFYSYEELDDNCELFPILYDSCAHMDDLNKAGTLFTAILIADMALLVFFILGILAIRLLLRNLTNKLLKAVPPSKFEVGATKCVMGGRFLLCLHPLIFITGLLIWTILADLSNIAGTVVIEKGLTIAMINGFSSLVLLAGYMYYITSSKRKNVLHMINNAFEVKTEANNMSDYIFSK